MPSAQYVLTDLSFMTHTITAEHCSMRILKMLSPKRFYMQGLNALLTDLTMLSTSQSTKADLNIVVDPH